jgi:hypothetical protein
LTFGTASIRIDSLLRWNERDGKPCGFFGRDGRLPLQILIIVERIINHVAVSE